MLDPRGATARPACMSESRSVSVEGRLDYLQSEEVEKSDWRNTRLTMPCAKLGGSVIKRETCEEERKTIPLDVIESQGRTKTRWGAIFAGLVYQLMTSSCMLSFRAVLFSESTRYTF
jgi:hypothetical protein